MTAELLHWRPVSKPLDPDLAVLIYPSIDGEVSEGFFDGAGSWAANPWVWAVEFRRAK